MEEKKSKNNNGVKKEKHISIRFYPYQFKKIEEYAEKQQVSKTDFVRDAILDKIKALENPELFRSVNKEVKTSIDFSIVLDEIKKVFNVTKEIEKVNDLVERLIDRFPVRPTEPLKDRILKYINVIEKYQNYPRNGVYQRLFPLSIETFEKETGDEANTILNTLIQSKTIFKRVRGGFDLQDNYLEELKELN